VCKLFLLRFPVKLEPLEDLALSSSILSDSVLAAYPFPLKIKQVFLVFFPGSLVNFPVKLFYTVKSFCVHSSFVSFH